NYPTLQRILVAYGDKIGYAADLAGALANLSDNNPGQSLSQGQPTNTTSPSSTSPPPSSPSKSAPPSTSPSQTATGGTSVESVLSQLDAAITQLQADYKSGNLAAIGTDLQKVQQLTTEYQSLRGSATASATPSHS
ncbi:MAG: hypothetical protein JO147_06340, partial [Actinobacteria bacterium]|nr:hypothetical protein [Actinomycetota bacterium]